MTCDDLLPRLDEYVEETLTPAERAEFAVHLLDCPACRGEVDALTALLRDTRALPRSITPESDLWAGIAARLGPRAAAPPRFRLRGSWPLGIAAALALLATGAVLGSRLAGGAEASFAREQARYAAATAELATALARDPAQIAPASRAVVEQNLAIIDQAVHEAAAALATDPGNPGLEAMLLARYQQRLELLRRAQASGRRVS